MAIGQYQPVVGFPPRAKYGMTLDEYQYRWEMYRLQKDMEDGVLGDDPIQSVVIYDNEKELIEQRFNINQSWFKNLLQFLTFRRGLS